MGELEAKIKAIRRAANKMHFPVLVQAVSAHLTAPLNFARHLSSLHKVRNCLEHRSGIVGVDDVSEDGNLTLSLPRMYGFVEREGLETEIYPGMYVDGGERIGIKTITRTRVYALGDTISFDADEFHEIAFGCSVLASDLVSKLPVTETALTPEMIAQREDPPGTNPAGLA